MDRLPDELIAGILKDHLNLNEIVKCRRISQRFRFLVDNYVSVFIDELTVSGELIEKFAAVRGTAQSYYERFGRAVNEKFHLKGKWKFRGNFWFLASPLCRVLFANLKCFTCSFGNWKADLEILNEFVRLESLIIEQKIILWKCQTLDLPRLKYFSLGCIECFGNVCLRIESKVEMLKANGLGPELKLTFPEQVRCIESNYLYDDFDLSSLKNLRTLKFRYISKSNWNLMERLPVLEEIYVKAEFEELRELRAVCEHLQKQKEILGRQSVRIYFCDILLTRPFESYGFERFDSTESPGRRVRFRITQLQIHHFEHLPDRVLEGSNMSGTNYNEVVDCLNDRRISLADFFKKFPNIQGIYVKEIKNEEDLLSFLKQCACLIMLEFRRGCLVSQRIVNQLPDCCHRLIHLRIEDRENKLDLSPLVKLKQLVKLSKEDYLYF